MPKKIAHNTHATLPLRPRPGTILLGDETGTWREIDVDERRRRNELAGLLVDAHRREFESILRDRQASSNRRGGRQQQASTTRDEWLDAFRTKVWPTLEPLYGKAGWKEEAARLCGRCGIGFSDRTLDRRLRDAREAGIIPRLRAPRR